MIVFTTESGKKIKIHTPIYFDDVINDLKQIRSRSDKIKYFKLIKEKSKSFEKVLKILTQGIEKKITKKEAKDFEVYINPDNIPGFTMNQLTIFMSSEQNDIVLKKNDFSRYCSVITCFTKIEAIIYIDYIMGKKFRFKGVAPDIINDVFDLGKSTPVNSNTDEI